MSVAITASVNGNEAEAHVSCPDCWWGEDVPRAEAPAVVEQHMVTDEHIENEVAGDQIEAALLRIWVERGY